MNKKRKQVANSLCKEFEEAFRLYCELHCTQANFNYKVSPNNRSWDGASWRTVTWGINYKSKKSYLPKLPKSVLRKIVLGQQGTIYNGEKYISGVTFIGIGFKSHTRSLSVDIDKGSKYHSLESLDKILKLTSQIGKPLFLRSSGSGGWHLRWYFDDNVKTWDLACLIYNLFTSNGFEIKDGQLEIFPNKKTFDSNYKPLRLPCQAESAFLSIEDERELEVWKSDPEIYMVHWADEVRKNLIPASKVNFLLSPIIKSSKVKNGHEKFDSLKENGFTGSNQTNRNLGAMSFGGVVYLAITDVSELTRFLCDWIDEKHNNYSEEYNKSPQEAYRWCARWAKCAIKKHKPLRHFFQVEKSNSPRKARGAEYEHIIFKALESNKINPEMSIRKIAATLGIPKSCVERRKNLILKQKISSCPSKVD